MLGKVNSAGLIGLDGYIVKVEIDISQGLPAFEVVGINPCYNITKTA